jgi:hypothetical protein
MVLEVGSEETVSITQAQEGQIAQISGVVHLVDTSLCAPHDDRPCAYYEVRDGLAGRSVRSEARSFVVEDHTGRALVVMEPERHEVSLAGRSVKEAIAVLDADINELSERLHDMKQQMRNGSPSEQRELLPVIRRHRELATVLCAIRAHARGRTHIKGTLDEQEAYIRKTSAKFEESEAKRAHKLFVERQEATLVEGQRVTVRGYFQWEPDPDPTAAAGGYRSRPLRLTIRAPAGERLLVLGEGIERAAEGDPREGEGEGPAAPVHEAGGRRSLFLLLEVLALLVGVGLIVLLVTC